MNKRVRIELIPLGVTAELNEGSSLVSALAANGVELPCGGSGLCGNCRVHVIEGSLPVTSEDMRFFTEEEIRKGWRLACRARACTPLKLEVAQWQTPVLLDASSAGTCALDGFGIAVDVGTTTLVAQLVDLRTGEVLGLRTALNPQAAYAADIMGRVSLALQDATLTPIIRQCAGTMVSELAHEHEVEIAEVVLVGNTVMHHLFCGLDVEPLSHAPFESPAAAEQQFSAGALGWGLRGNPLVRFLGCTGGFVGSDLLAGIVAVGLARGSELSALIDLGTNGEIAIGNCERVLCASTAAGPAFEAGSISCGMRAAAGAIHRVTAASGDLKCDVIGDLPARGICGSGLVDAVAAGLQIGYISPGGRFANGIRELQLANGVALSQKDVRELQLAKGAVAAGIRILLKLWGASIRDVGTVYLAGAFGNYVRPESAARVGLLEVDSLRVVPAGNTALKGAKMSLSSHPPLRLPPVEHIVLAADPSFQDMFVESLPFPAPATSAA